MYHLKVLTPEDMVFNDDIIALIAPGSTGYLGILTDHAPLITTLKTGVLTITDKNHTKHFYEISGGFLEVRHNEAYLLVDTIQTTAPVNMGGGI
jgi:F-type H+-transporting ATPase subunit epsilon